MNFITRSAKKSPRLIAVCSIIALVSTIGLASNWESVRFFATESLSQAFGFAEAESPANESPQVVLVKTNLAADSDEQLIPTAAVTTNGGSGLNLTYPDLASAITALNGATITSPVVITASGTETAPAGGYSITAQGTSTNTIIIDGGGATTITAGVGISTTNDAIFKLIGADWVTIQGFSLQESAGNTTTTTQAEWGVALLYATTTNGSQNDTIQNNTITLNRTNANTFGIYANATHSATNVGTSATATGAGGGNSGLKIYGNSISNVNQGIIVVGPTAATDNNNGVDVGGAGGAQANTIANFGTTTTSSYVNVSGTVNGILVRNSINFNVSFNNITSSAGGTTTGTLNGIQIPAFSVAPTGTFTNNINNNTISLQSGVAAGSINGINVLGTSATATSTLNINNNNFTTLNHSVAALGAIVGIINVGSNTAGPLTHSISNNSFTNLTTNTTGSFTFISNNWALPTGGLMNVNSNSIITAFNKTGVGGTVTLFLTSTTPSSPAGATKNEQNNNFSNITLTGATIMAGWTDLEGATGGGATKNVTGNTFSNWTCGSGAVTAIQTNFSGNNSAVSGNTISNINSSGAITGISIGSGNGGSENTSANLINTLTTTGASVVTGISSAGGTTSSVQNIFKNKIYNLEANNASGTVSGINVTAGPTNNVFNNLVGDLRTPAANAGNPLIGLNITGGTTVNAYFNTVYLNASSTGALFGSSAVSVSTTPAVTLRNNIFVNTSTVTGAGLTAAHRRSGTALTNYANASNNNLFYAGAPSATNLIFYDGTNSDLTLANYVARVTPRDAASVTENPPFLSTTGSSAQFLHISTVIATFIESGGSSISGITDDFDGDTRTTAPDIGADEFAGTSAGDFVPPSINYTLLGNTSSTADRTLTTTITDATGIGSGSGAPLIYYRKGTSGAFTSAIATTVSGSTYTFTVNNAAIGGVAANDIIQYYVAAQDTASTPNIATNPPGGSGINPPGSTAPASPNQYTILPVINTFPYSQDFETNNGGWTPGVTVGSTSDWEYGTFNKTQIDPQNGTNAWITKLVGTYTTSTTSTLISPVIDLSSLTGRPTFSFKSNFKTEAGFDAGVLEYSIDGGAIWTKIDGTLGTGGTFNTTDSTGWYNSSSSSGPIVPPKFSGTSTSYTGATAGWITSSTLLPAAVVGQSDVRLRFRFGADNSTNDEGWAIDDLSITPPSPGTLQFSTTAFVGTENASAVVTVTRAGGSAGAVAVNYATSDGTATAGTCGTDDYVAASGTLNWADGEGSSKTFNVSLCADATADPGETVNLTLSGATGGAVIGANNPAVLTITDVPPPLPTGSYTVGAGGYFTTLPTAINTLNSSGVAGAVELRLTDPTYTGTLPSFGVIPGASATNTVTIKPAVGVSPTITGGVSDTCVINLVGTDYLTIDGSNTAGGSTRDLNIVGANTNASAVVCVESTGASAGATNNTVKNTNISGANDYATSTTGTFGIYSGSTVVGTGLDGLDNDNNIFDNNSVTKVFYGIYVRGASANPNDNVVISRNTIGGAAFDATRIGKAGIAVENQNAVTITLNEVRSVGVLTANSATGSDRMGIGVGAFSWTPTNSVMTNAVVTRNSVHDIVEEKTFSSVGILLAASGTSGTNNLIANNMLYNVRANGTVSDQGVGIGIAGGDGDKVVFNSINLTGDIDPTGATAATQSAAGIRISSTTPTNLTLMNNAVAVDLTSNTSTLKHYAIVAPSAAYVWGTGGANYNDYYANPANTQAVLGGIGTSVPYSERATLPAWQTTFTPNQDLNSRTDDPLFVSATNLHLQATSTLESMGTAIAGVTVDFDGDARPATPDIGADEIPTPPAGTVQFSAATYSVSESGAMVTLTVTRTGGSNGAVTVNYSLGSGTATGTAACGTPGEDYVNTGGSVMFANGDATNKTFDVIVCNDAVYESGQTFNATLAIGSGSATLGTLNPATVTINNDDAAPTVAINDISAVEGNAGTTNFQTTFTVTGANEVTGGFSFQTADNSATAPSDYTAISPTAVVIPANVNRTTATLNGSIVLVNGDTTVEADETFFLNGSGCSDCSFADNQGVAAIQNDDASVQFSAATDSVGEGGVSITLTVTRTGLTTGTAAVNFATASGAATGGASCTAGIDYISNSGTLNFAAGDVSKTFNVTICDDGSIEGSEDFTATLSVPTGATLGTPATATVTITDNDADTTPPTVSYTPLSNIASTSDRTFNVTATDNIGVTAVTVVWANNSGGSGSLNAPCTFVSGTTWSCTILSGAGSPPQSNPGMVSYFVSADDAAGNSSTNPTGGTLAGGTRNLFTIGTGGTIDVSVINTFDNIVLGNGFTLNGSATVNGVLTLSGGQLNTGANTLTLGCNASVTGAGGFNYVIGNVQKLFCGTGSFSYPVGTTPNGTLQEQSPSEGIVTSEYTPFVANVTAGSFPSSLTVSVADDFLTGAQTTESASRYWSVTETGDLTADISFTYLQLDVNGAEASYNVLRRTTFTTSYPGGTVNAATNTATATGVSEFSSWSAGNAIPTAANAELSGRVLTANGEGIRNATVMLSGGTLAEPVYVQTGAFGSYRFEGLPVGQTYVVTVVSKRYTFANPSRIVILNDNVADENFEADPR